MTSNSVTLWIRAIENNDEAAAHALFDRYFQKVIQHARLKLASDLRRVVDEEDIAVMAFQACFQRISSGEHPQLKDRNELWSLLARIAERRACDVVRRHLTARRGKGRVRGESVFARSGVAESTDGLRSVPDPNGNEEVAAQMAEEYERMMGLLESDQLRDVAKLVLAGFSTSEIAEQLDRTQRTVQRRLKIILDTWSEGRMPENMPSNSKNRAA